MNVYDERVRASYWNTAYHNGTVREEKIARFLSRCDEECIPMDRVTAIALSDDDMKALSKRFFATSAEGARVKHLVHGIVYQRMEILLKDIQSALPDHRVSLSETLRHGLCIEVDGRRYAIESIVRTKTPSKL